MFICNISLNKNKIIKIFIGIILIFLLIILGLLIYNFLINTNNNTVNDDIIYPEINNVTSKNYTNVLKTVHENLESYKGQKIKFSGYIYRVYDFSENQFVLARNMVISSDLQTVVVGFLCNCKNANQFKDGTWVEITGEITKGKYHGEIPEIKITGIKETQKPSDEYVYPPDEGYVPTSAIL